MKSEEYIIQHLHDDIRKLALTSVPDGVDLKWCLQQIEGWQIAQKKLPCWAVVSTDSPAKDEACKPIEGLWYPPKLSMEQCSSEETARYKADVIKRMLPDKSKRTKMADLTGGYGVDFSYIAPLFKQAIYVEKLPHLCDIARHNFPLLGLKNTEIICSDATALSLLKGNLNGDGLLVYLDPARRDNVGRKTVAIEDCTPNVVELQDELLQAADIVMIKLSPMIDISEILRKLKYVWEIHVVSVRGECKEVLALLSKTSPIGEEVVTTVTCVNLATGDEPFVVDLQKVSDTICKIAHSIGKYLYEPNASILKAGVQDVLTERFPVSKLHPMSNLFTSDEWIVEFPGRKFHIEAVYDFSKNGLKGLVSNIKSSAPNGQAKANLTIRNFPGTVEALRKKLKLKEGGEEYLFATTLWDGSHCIIRCRK